MYVGITHCCSCSWINYHDIYDSDESRLKSGWLDWNFTAELNDYKLIVRAQNYEQQGGSKK